MSFNLFEESRQWASFSKKAVSSLQVQYNGKQNSGYNPQLSLSYAEDQWWCSRCEDGQPYLYYLPIDDGNLLQSYEKIGSVTRICIWIGLRFHKPSTTNVQMTIVAQSENPNDLPFSYFQWTSCFCCNEDCMYCAKVSMEKINLRVPITLGFPGKFCSFVIYQTQEEHFAILSSMYPVNLASCSFQTHLRAKNI